MTKYLNFLYLRYLSKLYTHPAHSFPSRKTRPPKSTTTQRRRHRFLQTSAIQAPGINPLGLIKGCIKSRHYKEVTKLSPSISCLLSECGFGSSEKKAIKAQLKVPVCRSTVKTSYQSTHAPLGSGGKN